jgi:phosphate transport system substrate-binding protein
MLALLFLSALVSLDISAQRTIKITGTRLTYPLLRALAQAYSKSHPGIVFDIRSGIPADSADILIVSHVLRPGDLSPGRVAITLVAYAQLPIVNSERKDLPGLEINGFSETDLRRIYFSAHPADTSSAPAAVGYYHFAVYKRAKSACASIAFAGHFGAEQKDIRGTGLPGDDQDLLEAVKKDTAAISYDNLGFIYDLRTRRVVDSIAVIPIDLNGDGVIDPSERVYNTLDEVIYFVEQTHNTEIPTDEVHAIIRKDNPDKAVLAFLSWALIKGRGFHHDYGFIHLRTEELNAQKYILKTLQ